MVLPRRQPFLRNLTLLIPLLLLLLFTSCAWGNVFDSMPLPTKCSGNTDPNTGTGPVMPSLPAQYKVRVEANMMMGSWSYELEEVIDTSRTMGATVLVYGHGGVRSQTVFNTDPLEKYEINDDDTCQAKPGGVDFHQLAFASLDQTSLHPSKISLFQPFQSAVNNSDLMFVEQTVVKGIKVNHWTLCEEWIPQGARIQADFYMSVPGHQSAYDQPQVPVRIALKGTTGDFNMAGIPKSRDFDNVYDFVSFNPAPFKKDEIAFQIPNNVVCIGGSATKTMPVLPETFEMDVELNAPHIGSSNPLVMSMRYDWTNQVLETVRQAATPQGLPQDKGRHKPISHHNEETKDKFQQVDWMSVKTYIMVEDFHTGLQYITLKNNNTCFVRPLPTASDSMTHGNMLLRLYGDSNGQQSQFSYQGRSTFRNMPVESWGMDNNGMVQKVFFLSRDKGPTGVEADTSGMTEQERKDFEEGVLKLRFGPLPKFPVLVGIMLRNKTSSAGTSFPAIVKDLVDGGVFYWNEDNKMKINIDTSDDAFPEDSTLKQFHSQLLMQETMTDQIGRLDVNINHFMPLHIGNELFHVSQCYKNDEISRVILTVKTSFEENVLHNPTFFLNSLRARVARAIGASVVQISNIQASPVVNSEKNIDATAVTFNLLGATPIPESKNEQHDIKESKKNLVTALKAGISFVVKYYDGSKSFLVDDKLYAMDLDLEDFPLVQDAKGDVTRKVSNMAGLNDGDDDNDDDDDSGYSGGVVAGVAIAVGIATFGITVVAILIFLKTRRPDTSPSIPYIVEKEC